MKLKELSNDEVHVYYYFFQNSDKKISELQQFLVPSEKIRAERFRFKRDMFKYITGRALLRQILGSYLNLQTCEIKINYNEFGKPMLSNTQNPDGIEFNLSHSSDMIVYSFCQGNQIGVDTEFINSSIDHIDTARQFCTQTELSYLKEAADLKELINRFYRIWTRKEAVLKASGAGISLELNKIEVLKDKVSDIDHLQSGWLLTDLNIDEQYKTAVAVSGKAYKIIVEHLPVELIPEQK